MENTRLPKWVMLIVLALVSVAAVAVIIAARKRISNDKMIRKGIENGSIEIKLMPDEIQKIAQAVKQS